VSIEFPPKPSQFPMTFGRNVAKCCRLLCSQIFVLCRRRWASNQNSICATAKRRWDMWAEPMESQIESKIPSSLEMKHPRHIKGSSKELLASPLSYEGYDRNGQLTLSRRCALAFQSKTKMSTEMGPQHRKSEEKRQEKNK